MMSGALKRQPDYMVGAEVLLLLAGGLALSLLLPRMSALWASAATLAATGLVVLCDVLLWSEAGMVLPLAGFLLMVAAIYTMSMAYGYFTETRVRRQVAERFGQYVPPEVVERIVADPGRYSMAPKAAELTILFSDVRGFTGISEALRPEELREYINAYLTDMSAIIRVRHRGTLDKYIGDAIMAFWGAPMENPGHARAAVLAALDMQKECKVLNAMFESRGWPALQIGVGLNTGSVRVGDMGSEVRLAYTVMGDAVNVASRLEGRTKHYGVGILAGEAVRAAVPDAVFREVDRIRVKGKDAALTVYEPIGLAAGVPAPVLDEIGVWETALRAYRAQRWDEAESLLARLQQMKPGCGLYALYAGRVAGWRRAPPPAGWDGVTRFDEK
jgi:adenylate cyclase